MKMLSFARFSRTHSAYRHLATTSRSQQYESENNELFHLDQDAEELLRPIDLNIYPNSHLKSNKSTHPDRRSHNIYVCQPWVSYSKLNIETEPKLQLAECISLCNTIPHWNVVGKTILQSYSLNRKDIVGRKALENLKNRISNVQNVSAVFFGVEVLSGIQVATMEKELELPVYDRFTVILNIFRNNATSREAKLQTSLAEIPYLRSHLRQIHESAVSTSANEPWKDLVGGCGDTYFHKRMAILKQRETKINSLLANLKTRRNITTKSRKRKMVPTISVVGYTNSGKTSLIKAITNDERLAPKDQLFATLDVTGYLGQLPSTRSAIFIDTIGFISRIPDLLINSFDATLSEMRECDLLIHVQDIHHPDHKLQRVTVLKTLKSISIPKDKIDSMLTIGNKIDLGHGSTENLPKCDLLISVKTGYNMEALIKLIDEKVVQILSKQIVKLRVLTGGDEYTWLRTVTNIQHQELDEMDQNYSVCSIKMSQAELGKYKKKFGTDTVIEDADWIDHEESFDDAH